jgi:DHA2 family integral membrane protein (MFS transporter)
MNDTTRELGGALGVAILGSILASRYSASIVHSLGTLPPRALGAAKSSVGGAIILGQSIGGPAGRAVAAAAKAAFVSAMGSTLQVGALVALAGALVSAIWLPNRARSAQPAEEGGAEPVAGAGDLLGVAALAEVSLAAEGILREEAALAGEAPLAVGEAELQV